MARIPYRLTRDIVIPAGTEVFELGYNFKSTLVSNHGSALYAINADATADLTFDMEEAIDSGLVAKDKDNG